MKRVAVGIAAAVMVFALMGCSSGTASSSASTDQATTNDASASASGSGSSLFTAGEWPQTYATEGVPVPNFGSPDDVSTTEHGATVHWASVGEKDVAAYVEELKAAGFVYDVMEHKQSDSYSYNAQNNDRTVEATNIVLSYQANGDLRIVVMNNRPLSD